MRFGMTLLRLSAVALLSTAVGGSALAADTDAQLIARVRQSVVAHKLVDRPNCVDYVITRKIHPLIDQVELRERHDATCGGDPQTSPRMFDVIIDRQNGQMASDAADPADGGMQSLD